MRLPPPPPQLPPHPTINVESTIDLASTASTSGHASARPRPRQKRDLTNAGSADNAGKSRQRRFFFVYPWRDNRKTTTTPRPFSGGPLGKSRQGRFFFVHPWRAYENRYNRKTTTTPRPFFDKECRKIVRTTEGDSEALLNNLLKCEPVLI